MLRCCASQYADVSRQAIPRLAGGVSGVRTEHPTGRLGQVRKPGPIWCFPKPPLARAGEGRILAIKGVGGFHLAVDALNDEAVRRLRQAQASRS